MRRALPTLLALSLIAGCADPAPARPDPAAVADEVKAAIHAQVDAYAAHDPARAGSIVADDFIGMFHGAPNVTSKAASAQATAAQMADPALHLAVSDEAVDVAAAGDLAVYRATYRYTFTDPATKGPATETGNWVAVFRRQTDGTMKMIRDMVLDTPAAPAG